MESRVGVLCETLVSAECSVFLDEICTGVTRMFDLEAVLQAQTGRDGWPASDTVKLDFDVTCFRPMYGRCAQPREWYNTISRAQLSSVCREQRAMHKL